MKGVLVDTSVWVAHFRQRNDALVALLALDQVMMHPLIVGELACGTPPARATTLLDLDGWPTKNAAGDDAGGDGFYRA